MAKSKLASSVLESYKFEYQDYTEWWRSLDRKAQGTITIAGIMLAGGFAFVRQLSVNTPLYEKLLLLGVVIFLLGAIALAVFSLAVREIDLPPSAEEIEELAQDCLAVGDVENLPERVAGLVYDQSSGWNDCNKILYYNCHKKAKKIKVAQLLILVVSVLMAIVAIIEIFTDSPQVSRRQIDAVQQTGMQQRGNTTRK